jgi:quinohemoprotein ethanol dehydrogenase
MMGRVVKNSTYEGGEYFRVSILLTLLYGTTIACLGCGGQGPSATSRKNPEGTGHVTEVDDTRIASADKEPGNWMSYGRTYDEQRFSPLRQISDRNVQQLSLAW